jgi:hypothetical protein
MAAAAIMECSATRRFAAENAAVWAQANFELLLSFGSHPTSLRTPVYNPAIPNVYGCHAHCVYRLRASTPASPRAEENFPTEAGR